VRILFDGLRVGNVLNVHKCGKGGYFLWTKKLLLFVPIAAAQKVIVANGKGIRGANVWTRGMQKKFPQCQSGSDAKVMIDASASGVGTAHP